VEAKDAAIAEKVKVEKQKVVLEGDISKLNVDIKDIEEQKKHLSESIEPMRMKQVEMQTKIDAFPAKLEAQDKAFATKTAEQKKKFEAQEKELKEQLNAEIDTLDLQKEKLSEEKEALAGEKQNLEEQVVNLNESSKLLRYKSGLTQVTTNLQTGDYINARKNLDKFKNLQDWEVARLNLLAHREIKSVYPAEELKSGNWTTWINRATRYGKPMFPPLQSRLPETESTLPSLAMAT